MRFPLFVLAVSAVSAILVPQAPGPLGVAYSAIPLTDKSRWDPYAPADKPHKRRFMTSVFLPVDEHGQCSTEVVPYMPPKTAIAYGLYAAAYGLPNNTFQQFEFEFCSLSSMRESNQKRKYPLVLFSPGLTASRLLYSAQARALASYGYVVITVDHPYDATYVEFPDGTEYNSALPPIISDDQAATAVDTRQKDVSFLLDQLSHPSKQFPSSLKCNIDLTRTLIYGHSLGGATAASTTLFDPRILSGLDIDGTPYGPVTTAGLDKPFFYLGKAIENGIDPTIAPFFEKLRGKKQMMRTKGATHYSYIDLPVLFTTLDIPEELKEQVEYLLGTVEGRRMESIILGVLRAFADLVLEDDSGAMLNINQTFPEVVVMEQDLFP